MKIIGDLLGFQAKEACALSGVQYKRLDYWARSRFITPSLATPDEGKQRFRFYSFNDVVALTVARKLRDVGFSMAALRRIKRMLEKDYQNPLAHAWLISDGRDIFELRRNRRDILSLLQHPGQICLPVTVLDLGRTAEELVEMAAQTLQTTKGEMRERIARGETVKTRQKAVVAE